MKVDLGFVVDGFAVTTVTRVRAGAGTYTAGVYVPGATTSTAIRASVTVPSAAVLQVLPEGLRSRARWLVHTTADVRPLVEGGSGTVPDRITHDGKTWTPVELQAWSQHGGYRRFVLVEEVP